MLHDGCHRWTAPEQMMARSHTPPRPAAPSCVPQVWLWAGYHLQHHAHRHRHQRDSKVAPKEFKPTFFSFLSLFFFFAVVFLCASVSYEQNAAAEAMFCLIGMPPACHAAWSPASPTRRRSRTSPTTTGELRGACWPSSGDLHVRLPPAAPDLGPLRTSAPSIARSLRATRPLLLSLRHYPSSILPRF